VIQIATIIFNILKHLVVVRTGEGMYLLHFAIISPAAAANVFNQQFSCILTKISILPFLTAV
jgi:hypothetical protein